MTGPVCEITAGVQLGPPGWQMPRQQDMQHDVHSEPEPRLQSLRPKVSLLVLLDDVRVRASLRKGSIRA